VTAAAESDDDILDGLFHACALRAYLDQAQAEQGWPDPDATRRRAYDYYERALAEKNRRKSPPQAEAGEGSATSPGGGNPSLRCA
jgi:hypothetical protein